SQDETGATRIKDLPDFALYAYAPLPGKKSKMVELEVIHYTSHKSHRQIKECFEKKKKPVLFMDQAGWTYFLAEALPQGLKMNDARRVIGTGEQFYADKVAPRNPEEEIHLRIRVPKECVLVKDEFYTINGGRSKIWVKKYAVAGGITKEDIVGSPESQRYRDRNLLQDQRYRHREKEKW
ncbi:MAG: hypothetical protein Q8L34_06385, partial [Candidatus Woesearchaeota archaeon]|nr:hypothetical protein [Candidatus Woesearchaeota archaeon]